MDQPHKKKRNQNDQREEESVIVTFALNKNAHDYQRAKTTNKSAKKQHKSMHTSIAIGGQYCTHRRNTPHPTRRNSLEREKGLKMHTEIH